MLQSRCSPGSRRVLMTLFALVALSACTSSVTPDTLPAVEPPTATPRALVARPTSSTTGSSEAPSPPSLPGGDGAFDYGDVPALVVTTPFPTVALPEQPASNFALTFGYGACQTTRILNTFDRTLTQFDLDGTPTSVSVTVEPADLERIYRFMATIAFFSYPERYSTILPDTMVRIMPSPHPTYEFRVRNGDLEKTVVFTDNVFRPLTVETEHLRALVTLLKAVVEAQPELSELPPLREACA